MAFRATAAIVAAVSARHVRLVWYVIVAQPVRNDWRIPAKMGRDIFTRWIEPGDPLFGQVPRPEVVIASRFAQGAICLAAERNGELLGFIWLCPRRYVEDDVRCVFVLPPSGETWWDFDVWVQASRRNGIVFAILWQAAHVRLRDAGVLSTCSRITRNNSGSLAAHRRLGAIEVDNVLFACSHRWQLAIGGKPSVHLSRDDANMPRIIISPSLKPSSVPDSAAATSRSRT
ncbi:MAG: N-acetyltransferase [Betaproteobacteria bacterium]